MFRSGHNCQYVKGNNNVDVIQVFLRFDEKQKLITYIVTKNR